MVHGYGQFRLCEKIATGGMAEIFYALSPSGDAAAVKRMLPELAVRGDFVQMFMDEARLAQRFSHPNLVRVLELGEASGHIFMAMEFVDGPHLGGLFAHSLRARRPLPEAYCAWIIAEAARGLHHAHGLTEPDSDVPLGVIHRDISPQNILVSRDGEVKVTDFGVAKAAGQNNKTRTGIIKGKVSYMSPEQCLAEPLDSRTDVFALGIVLYELLTRRRLFRHKSDLRVMQRITSEVVPPPSTLNPDVPPGLDAITMTALQKPRNARYQSGAALAAAIDAWLAAGGFEIGPGALAAWAREAVPMAFVERSEAAAAARVAADPSLLPEEPSVLPQPAAPDMPAEGALASDVSAPEDVSAAPLDDALHTPAPAPAEPNPWLDTPPTAPTRSVRIERRWPWAASLVAAAGLAAAAWGFWPAANPAGAGEPGEGAGKAAVNAPAGQAEDATLWIKTMPPGVRVDVNGTDAGVSPATLHLPPGDVVVRAHFEAGVVQRTVTAAAGAPVEVDLRAQLPVHLEGVLAGTTVVLDGEPVGTWPLAAPPMAAAGEAVLVELVHPERAPLALTVMPAVNAAPTAVAQKPKSPVRQAEDARRDRPARTVRRGTLSINTTPWTTVYLGKKKLGTTPLLDVQVPAGRVRLRVRNPGMHLDTTLRVTVPAGKKTVVNQTIKTGIIDVSGAKGPVQIDAEPASGKVKVFPGEHRVIVNGKSRRVTVRAGKTVRIQ